MFRKSFHLAFAGSLVCFGVLLLSSQPPHPAQPALATVRLINTAEVYANRAHGRYVSLSDLVSTEALKNAAAMNGQLGEAYSQLNLNEKKELLQGFDLELLVANDGRAYKLSLVNNKEGCGTAYFSDERGLIYEGKALDCAK